MSEDNNITIQEYVKLLYEKNNLSGTIEDGYNAGWLDQLDVIRKKKQ